MQILTLSSYDLQYLKMFFFGTTLYIMSLFTDLYMHYSHYCDVRSLLVTAGCISCITA